MTMVIWERYLQRNKMELKDPWDSKGKVESNLKYNICNNNRIILKALGFLRHVTKKVNARKLYILKILML